MQLSLQNLFQREYARAKRNGGSGKVMPPPDESADIDSYKEELATLPAAAYKDLSIEALLPKDFKNTWGNDTKACLVFLPFDDGGNMKDGMLTQGSWDKFLTEKKFMKLLEVRATKLTNGFPNMSDPPGRYFELLPVEIRKDISEGGCSFHVEYKNPQNLYDTEDRAWFAGQCQKALENLKRILGARTGGTNDAGLN